MGNIKSVAGESDITPLNGYVRIQGHQVAGHMGHGIVTDDRVGQCKTGETVYFPRDAAVFVPINDIEAVFIKESDIIFKVG